MLYRFRKAMRSSDDAGFVASASRPSPGGARDGASPAGCTSIAAALRARRELRKSLGRQIMRIQDASLDADTIRRLNDQINESLRTVRAWDECLLRLGHRMEREEGADGALYGNEVVNVHGYWYFGRARELPGVCELLQEQGREREREREKPFLEPRLRKMMEQADDEYFGRVQDDAAVGEEEAVERTLRDKSQLDWITGLALPLPPLGRAEFGDREADMNDASASPSAVESITIVPTQEQVGAYLVERRREELLKKYARAEER